MYMKIPSVGPSVRSVQDQACLSCLTYGSPDLSIIPASLYSAPNGGFSFTYISLYFHGWKTYQSIPISVLLAAEKRGDCLSLYSIGVRWYGMAVSMKVCRWNGIGLVEVCILFDMCLDMAAAAVTAAPLGPAQNFFLRRDER